VCEYSVYKRERDAYRAIELKNDARSVQVCMHAHDSKRAFADALETLVANDFYEIALIGFTPSEHATFETFFRLVSSRRPKPYRAIKETSTASLVVVNAINQFAVAAVIDQLRADQLLITVGITRSERAWRHLDRPINLNAVLVTLDSAFAVSSAAAAAKPAAAVPAPTATVSAAASPSITPARPLAPPIAPSHPVNLSPQIAAPARVATPANPPLLRPAATPAPLPERFAAPAVANNVAPFPAPARTAAFESATAKRAEAPKLAQQPTEQSSTAAERTRILVVDDSDVALKFIHNRLSAFGFHVDQCTSGEEALVRVSDGDYQFVFLDVMMAGLDGYQTCKAIKGRRYAGSRAPVVVMLTSRGGTIDKVRGTFAGCDAYLTKPLDESKMLKVLLKHDSGLGDSISTLAQPTVMTAPLPSRETNKPNPLAKAYEGLGNRGS
jgi:two-component system, cell cycle response regulator